VTLAAAAVCGVDEVYAMGGAQAIFALADGTETIKPVDVIAGPGNRWVQEAKRAVFGKVGIDTLAGPSELMLVAGHDSDPRSAALDLCAQAEHGADGLLVLAAVEEAVLDRIGAEVDRVAAERQTVTDAPLASVQVDDLGDAVALRGGRARAPPADERGRRRPRRPRDHGGGSLHRPGLRHRLRRLRGRLEPHPSDGRRRPLLRAARPAGVPAPDRECNLARRGGR
jgi:ParB-like chromosome segregation protein Spo0J